MERLLVRERREENNRDAVIPAYPIGRLYAVYFAFEHYVHQHYVECAVSGCAHHVDRTCPVAGQADDGAFLGEDFFEHQAVDFIVIDHQHRHAGQGGARMSD